MKRNKHVYYQCPRWFCNHVDITPKKQRNFDGRLLPVCRECGANMIRRVDK